MLMYKQQLLGSGMKRILQKLSYTSAALIMVLSVSLMAFSSTASAAQITTRKVTLGSSVPSASTTYTLSTAALPTATAVQSLEMVACTTASGACTPAPGFTSVGSATTGITTGLGTNTGWTNNTVTANKLRITQTNAVVPSGVVSVPWTAVTNPSAANSTFYLRINTYSDTAWTTPLDSGVVAVATAGQITVTAAVDETLTFTLASATVALGTLTTGTTGTGTSTMTAATNGQTGYAISVNGTTLTASSGTIPAYSAAASAAGTAGFGINLVANTVPSVGTAVSGTGTGTAATGYQTTNTFNFLTGATVASVGAASNSNTYTVSYVANISPVTPAGAYSTALTYIATATF